MSMNRTTKLYIDGVAMPMLKQGGLTISRNKVWSSNTGRTSSGLMVGDLIRICAKLQCEFVPLDPEDTALLDNAVSRPFFRVTYEDPTSGRMVSKTMYAGDATYPIYTYANGQTIYDGVGVDLIEQ